MLEDSFEQNNEEDVEDLPEGEEWEDDNDLGYIQVFVSEEEFFEIEEVKKTNYHICMISCFRRLLEGFTWNNPSLPWKKLLHQNMNANTMMLLLLPQRTMPSWKVTC